MATPRSAGESPSGSLAAIIEDYNGGDAQAQACLIERLYRDLRRIAAVHLRTERRNHTLQPTALVHEAYTRLARQSEIVIKDRVHFLAIASYLMRQVLVDHAKARRTAKRGGGGQQVTLDERMFVQNARSLDILLLDELLQRLTKLNARHGRIVELHFFGGLSFEEIAGALGIGLRTVNRDWAMARAWLRSELSASA
jgi:RNA polymerase sigma-70 factor (ECF subfamily)